MSEPRTTKKELVTAFRTGEILAAARGVMAQKGLDSLTMDDIAQAAGVAKGTLYLYFQSKDELIQALLTQVGEAMARDLEAIVAAPDPPPDKLRRVAALLLQYVEQERELFPVYLRELVRSKSSRAGVSPFLHKHEERTLGLITEMFTEGMVSKQFINVNPRLLAYLLKGMGRAVGYFQMTGQQQDAIQGALPVILKIMFSGIMLPPEIPEEDAL
ncbi:MAG: TetR/AcrR family transcriptional regulator [Thermodesulfobacteriota bacterium]